MCRHVLPVPAPHQVVIPTVLIVYIGMMSAFLSADDHSGDRAALLGVSILICMVNLDRDHGLGKLTYSTWFDWFNLVQLGVQVVCLLEGFVEHKLIKMDHEDACIMLNHVWLVTMMCGIYPLVTAGVCLLGAGHAVVGWVLMGGVLPVIMVLGMWYYHRKLGAQRRNRDRVVQELRATPMESPNFADMIVEAFEAFDLDNSGSLDMKEISILLQGACGKDKAMYSKLITEARQMAAASNGAIFLNDLNELLAIDFASRAGRTLTRSANSTRCSNSSFKLPRLPRPTRRLGRVFSAPEAPGQQRVGVSVRPIDD
jgi:hypothetical protein